MLKNKEKYQGCCSLPVPTKSLSELPEQYDWCDVDGQSYCTASWNQHQPKYCGACWVHGTLSAVNDRIKVQRQAKGIDVMLARQVLLNCGNKYGFGNGCHGGESADVFEFMRLLGLPDETCYNYMAEDGTCPESGEGFCINCMMFGGDVTDYKCWAVDNYVKFHIQEYGHVHGEAAIMSEVLARGPITCGMVCPDDFVYGYDGGIFRYFGNETDMDHDVEVVGWGEEDGQKYWKIRNSWGSYWGENGFFRLARGENNLRIEESCMFAIPESREEDKVLAGKEEGSMWGERKVKKGESPHETYPESYTAPKDPHEATKPHPIEAAAIPTEAEALPTVKTITKATTGKGISYVFVLIIVISLSGFGLLLSSVMKRARQVQDYEPLR